MNDAPAPVAILHQGCCLIVSVYAALDDTQMEQFRRELGRAVGGRRARAVLIDVAALDVIDSFGSRTIREIAEASRLRGATAVIVGIQPDLALAMVQLGIEIGAILTALDLEDGLDAIDVRQPGERGSDPLNARRRAGSEAKR